MQNLSEPYNIELDEEFLNFVSGGVYSPEEWERMTPEERKQAWMDSLANRAAGVYCQLD